MPKRGDTRARLLAAALDEFETHGFAGGRVDAIARRAGANKRMIYHFFGSKSGLWEALFSDEMIAELAPERRVRLHMWRMLASKDLRSLASLDVQSRAVEISAMQSSGTLRNDVDPTGIAALERLIGLAEPLAVVDRSVLPDPEATLTELLNRLVRPRIRVMPRVVPVPK